MTYSYNISIGFLITVVFYFVYLRFLITHIKNQHSEIYENFGGKRIWYSAPDQLKFFSWLFTQKHKNFNDSKLSKLAVTTQVLFIIAVICLFTAPLSIQGSS